MNDPSSQQRVFRILAVGGAAIVVGGLAFAWERAWSNLLLGAFFLVTLALGGATFVALTYVCGAGWHTAFRRIPEALARLLPITGLAMLIVLGMNAAHFHYETHGAPGTFWFKELWLSTLFWMARAIVYVTLWVVLSHNLLALSSRQNQTSDAAIVRNCVRWSAVFLAVYAVTFSLACIDWLMALEPLWFSTMWGVYNFSGMIQATLAAVIILGLVLRQPGGPLHRVFRDDHLHDLGKLLLGFSCFWMYIWFSQYMLIWYANIPEETSYFVSRIRGPWGPVVVVLIILNWIIPFFVLLPRPAKRSPSVMMKVAIIVLIGRWVDLYVMIFPSTMAPADDAPNAPVFGILELATVAALVGITGWISLRAFRAAPSVPANDPFLGESLNYHA